MNVPARQPLWYHNVAAGMLWVLVYNAVWGLAWFGFMRGEWERAAFAAGRQMPWTTGVWVIWVLLTFPIGVGMMSYAAGRKQKALIAAGSVWTLFTAGMVGYGLSDGLSPRVLILDAGINLFGVITASLIAVWMPGGHRSAQLSRSMHEKRME